ncbi:M23 family metallopeptidase [Pseudarthrobacter sp. J75]|uniref:M23 family metallopeptidase n=1 Tax=unclassified Pseudarthrobacter TaxID=2647000 RepID=UPI002E8032E6|nr:MULTISPECIES: M23 family metallopeptidase [unclassified Pseudarthrobacter]MEE2523205.1 M23 family metallopeptidase [Pseudarthrobacter sp. J47]MEE2527460.1 M23 family metallopeptidase [Pseudarthrobacter sp. J75]
MTTQNFRGRRRAVGSASQPWVAEVPLADRPRDPQREARRRRSPFRQLTDFAAASGIGQKAGVALAATGLLLTVTVPVTSPVLASSSAPSVAAASGASAAVVAAPQPAVSAEAAAQIDFSRTAVTTVGDPDGKLKQLLSAQSAGTVAPAASRGTIAGPLASLTTVSPYGYRVSPITGGTGDFHRGTDFAAQCGTPVLAAATGTVTFAGWHPYGGGNRVVVDHGNGLETTYNHLSSFSAQVGQTVTRGDVVALSGTTGASTGCHLHFEVQVGGEVVDPTGWL